VKRGLSDLSFHLGSQGLYRGFSKTRDVSAVVVLKHCKQITGIEITVESRVLCLPRSAHSRIVANVVLNVETRCIK
jgi:hypothetical protein